MTLIRDEGGRAILEGTVHVVIAFNTEGNIIGTFSAIKKKDVEDWVKRQEVILPVVKYTLASIREML